MITEGPLRLPVSAKAVLEETGLDLAALPLPAVDRDSIRLAVA